MSDDCVTVFNDLKLKHDKKYIIFSMNATMTEIQVQMNEEMFRHANYFG